MGSGSQADPCSIVLEALEMPRAMICGRISGGGNRDTGSSRLRICHHRSRTSYSALAWLPQARESLPDRLPQSGKSSPLWMPQSSGAQLYWIPQYYGDLQSAQQERELAFKR